VGCIHVTVAVKVRADEDCTSVTCGARHFGDHVTRIGPELALLHGESRSHFARSHKHQTIIEGDEGARDRAESLGPDGL
jgi:hypothetical protein